MRIFLSSASSSVTSTTSMSSFATSINLPLCLPSFFFPGSSILSILLLIHPSSFLRTSPNHLNLASRVFSLNRPTYAVPLMYSFLILSILVTPNGNRNIFNSATSISASRLFVSAIVSNPYNIAGLTATLYTFPFQSSWYSPIALPPCTPSLFTLAGTRLSHCHLVHLPFHSSWYSPVALPPCTPSLFTLAGTRLSHCHLVHLPFHSSWYSPVALPPCTPSLFTLAGTRLSHCHLVHLPFHSSWYSPVAQPPCTPSLSL